MPALGSGSEEERNYSINRAETPLLYAGEGFRAIYPFSHLIFIRNSWVVYCYYYFPEKETDLRGSLTCPGLCSSQMAESDA